MSPSRGPSESPHSNGRSSSPIEDDTGTSRPSRQRRSGRTDQQEPRVMTTLKTAGRVVECAQIERQLRFQHLVRRYLSQILYGCRSAYCTTPSCLSCNKRLLTRPHRAPTHLTARALAHFLASQDNPYDALCPHQLKVSPQSFQIDGAQGVEYQRGSKRNDYFCSVLPTAGLPACSAADLLVKSAVVKFDGSRQESAKSSVERGDSSDPVRNVLATLRERQQVKKDVKSLGQSLYDTATVIYSYSKEFPTALSVFNSLREPYVQRNMHNQTGSISASTVVEHDRSNGLGNAVLKSTNSHIATHLSERNVTPVSRNSQSDPILSESASSQQFTSQSHLGKKQIHKIHHHPRDRRTDDDLVQQISALPRLDGTPDNRPRENMKKPSTRFIDKNNGIGPYQRLMADDASTTKPERRHKLALRAASHLDCRLMEQLKEDVYEGREKQSSNFVFALDFQPNRSFRPTTTLVNRSLFYALSDTETLLRSFHDKKPPSVTSPLPHLDSISLTHAFRDWNQHNGALIFDSLWIALESLFIPPPEIDHQKSPRLKASRKHFNLGDPLERNSNGDREETTLRYLSDKEAAHVIMISIHALTSLVSTGWPRTWKQLRNFRSWGVILPYAPQSKISNGFVDPWLDIIDELEFEPANRFADRLLRAIGARVCFEQILNIVRPGEGSDEEMGSGPIRSHLLDILIQHLEEVERVAYARKRKMKTSTNFHDDPGWTVTATFLEWLRTIIIKQWNGKAIVNRWSSVGVAIMILDKLYAKRRSLNLRTHMFYMPWLDERLDKTNEPVEFLKWKNQPNSIHLLQYPCLFQPDHLIAYFRTINFVKMYKHYEHSERVARLQRHLNRETRESYFNAMSRRLGVALSNYLVLEVGRQNPLEDALNQLWGQERRLLLKPLKVKMGKEEGEIGHDQGGITYEFFRVVLGEAFNANNGMFEVDPHTRMTWFKPASLEPDWKFEMLGVLFSLAMYNGVTLPVTFPLALYHNLLAPSHPRVSSKYPTSVNFIRDGWPTLAKSFDEFLSWEDGDVADVFLRSYTFSFEAFGRNYDVDMQSFDGTTPSDRKPWPAECESSRNISTTGPYGPVWPPDAPRPPLDSPAWERPAASESLDQTLVTNENREKYVADYIFWLTHKSVASQLLAFRKGFHACLHPHSLHLFDQQALKNLIEGTPDIDVAKLKAATRYEEGYCVHHTTIVDFWSIVEQYDMDNRRRLLEFVTASERVPVTGFETMNFHIVRNGSDTEMLPTSSTCFGKLMLPEYATKEKLERKLDLAIQNCKGFGVL